MHICDYDEEKQKNKTPKGVSVGSTNSYSKPPCLVGAKKSQLSKIWKVVKVYEADEPATLQRLSVTRASQRLFFSFFKTKGA